MNNRRNDAIQALISAIFLAKGNPVVEASDETTKNMIVEKCLSALLVLGVQEAEINMALASAEYLPLTHEQQMDLLKEVMA